MIFIYMAVFVFSLVELIIVIAIMAILVGVVAATVIPYLEKSRKAKDQQQLSSVTTSAVSAISDLDKAIKGFDNTYATLVGSKTGTGDSATFTAGALNGLAELLNNEDAATLYAKFKSKAFQKDAGTAGANIMIAYGGVKDASDTLSGTATGNSGSLAEGQVVTYLGGEDVKYTDKKPFTKDKNEEAISE